MNNYIVNKNAQADGYHEVHNEDTCSHLPDLANRINAGQHNNCQSAVQSVKSTNPKALIDGCNNCHTR